MAKLQKKWINLDPNSWIRAEDIPFDSTKSTKQAIEEVAWWNKFNNFHSDDNDFTHTSEDSDDTIYFKWEWIKVYWEVVDWKKIIRFDLISHITKKCFEIDSSNEDENEWCPNDADQNWEVTEVYLNWIWLIEWNEYNTKDYCIVLSDWIIQDWDNLCLVYPRWEVENKWVWDMVIEGWIFDNQFIVS